MDQETERARRLLTRRHGLTRRHLGKFPETCRSGHRNTSLDCLLAAFAHATIALRAQNGDFDLLLHYLSRSPEFKGVAVRERRALGSSGVARIEVNCTLTPR